MRSATTLILCLAGACLCLVSVMYAQAPEATVPLQQLATAGEIHGQASARGRAQAVRRLLADVPARRPEDEDRPRLMKAFDGTLRNFAAPKGRAVPLSGRLRGLDPETQARGFLEHHGMAFGIYSPNVALSTERVNSKGNRDYVRFEQTYDGIPVYGANVIVGLSDSDGVHVVISDIMRRTGPFDEERIPTVPSISADEAEALALAAMGDLHEERVRERLALLAQYLQSGTISAEVYGESVARLAAAELNGRREVELVIRDPQVLDREADGEPSLVWIVGIRSSALSVLGERVFIDAHTGELLLHSPTACNVANREINNGLWLHSTILDPVIADNGGPYYPRPAAYWEYNYNYLGFTRAYTYYNSATYNIEWDSLNNDGLLLKSYVHWDPLPTAGYDQGWVSDPDDDFFFFGLGYFDSAQDVIAHEYAHGVTAYTSKLLYEAKESGAINASLSDIFGEFIDQTFDDWLPSPFPPFDDLDSDGPGYDWLIGEDTDGGAFRDMSDPPNPPGDIGFGVPAPRQPETYKGDHWYYGSSVGTYVDTNSGVGNKLAYLITAGGPPTGPIIPGMGRSKASQLFWLCNENLLPRAADYQDLYFGLHETVVANPTIFTNSDDEITVRNASLVVGIVPVGALTIASADDKVRMTFSAAGELRIYYEFPEILFGPRVLGNASVALLRPTSAADWIIRNGPDDSDVLARFDTTTGNFYLKGLFYTWQTGLEEDPAASEFIVQYQRGTSTHVRLLLDDQGNLKITGDFYRIAM